VNYFTLFSRALTSQCFLGWPAGERDEQSVAAAAARRTGYDAALSRLFFEDLQHAPVRDDAKLDALAMHILDEGPKTLLGLVIRARAEKWLRRHLWTLAYDSLSPLEQGVRVVIDSTMHIDCDRPRQVFA